MNIFLLFSHSLTAIQTKDIFENLKCKEIIKLPKELQEIWSNVNPHIHENEKLDKIKSFLKENGKKGDYVLIQGEWGFTYHMVNFSKDIGLIPVYSTTERVYEEEIQPDGSVKNIHFFKHIKFKEY
ncbi:MAG: hypothetical protein KBA47_00295 [Caldisericia bacterium]|nr:hypothetical protein [Caldisericia bacterium]